MEDPDKVTTTANRSWSMECKKDRELRQVSPPDSTEPRNYGGFYTQDDIKELVAYAKERYVNILPEIEMPGHSLAAIAAYPDLSATPGKYVVNSGEKFMEWPASGIFMDWSTTPSIRQVKMYMYILIK
jgi:hexosaminidase